MTARAHVLAVLITLAIGATATAQTTDVPLPDLSSAEPQVRAKLTETHDAALREPTSAAAWGHYAIVLHGHRCFESADAAYAVAARLDPSDYRWPYLRAVVLLLREPKDAAPLLDDAVRLGPHYVPALIRRGMLRERLGDPAGAKADFERAVELERANGAAHKYLGLLLLSEGDAQRAVRELEAALQLRPGDGAVLSGLARALRAVGRVDEARRRAEQARRTKPSQAISDPLLVVTEQERVNLLSYVERSKSLARAGKLDEAEAELDEALEFAPDDGALLISLAFVARLQGDYTKLATVTQRAIDLGVEETSLHEMHAIALHQIGRHEAALEAVRIAIAERENDPGAHQLHGEILAALGRKDEAIAALEFALEKREDAAAHQLTGSLLLDAGHPDPARRHFERVVALEPNAPRAWLMLGTACAQLDAEDDAVTAITRARTLAPNDPVIIRGGAAALIAVGRYHEARQCLTDGLSRLGKAPWVVNDLAWLLATCPDADVRDGARAVELAERVAANTGRMPVMLATLAAAYAESGRMVEAVRTMEEAIQKAEAAGAPAERIGTFHRLLTDYRSGRPHRSR